MKKIYLLIFFLFIIGYLEFVSAETYDCFYDVPFLDHPLKIAVDTDNINNGLWAAMVDDDLEYIGKSKYEEFDWMWYFKTQQYYINAKQPDKVDEFYEERYNSRINNIFSGFCPSKIFVTKGWSDSAQMHYTHIILNDGAFKTAAIMQVEDLVTPLHDWGIINTSLTTAPIKIPTYTCDYYAKQKEILNGLYNKIESCEDDCVHYYNQYNDNLSELGAFCKSQLMYLDYSDTCLLVCLKADEEIKSLDDLISNSRICGFSEKLIKYIANIIKWVKYLVPIVTIILGILDFIKVVGTDKDDEMKKAQGKFVKRLIAAALIFIIPFIIEFILEKMGFVANGCGIIDL